MFFGSVQKKPSVFAAVTAREREQMRKLFKYLSDKHVSILHPTMMEVDWVESTGECTRKPLLEMLLTDLDNFDYDNLVWLLGHKGVELPSQSAPITRALDAGINSYFDRLILDSREFFIAMQSNYQKLLQKDDQGRTILHWINLSMSYRHAKCILSMLFRMRELDFAAKDKDENTALHIAARNFSAEELTRYVFKELLEEAQRRNFDFTTKGEHDLTILDIAVAKTRNLTHQHIPQINPVAMVLKVAPSLGEPALLKAIQSFDFGSANILLNSGVDPEVFGGQNTSPFAEVQRLIEELPRRQHDSQKGVPANTAETAVILAQLDALGRQMQQIAQEKFDQKLVSRLATW